MRRAHLLLALIVLAIACGRERPRDDLGPALDAALTEAREHGPRAALPLLQRVLERARAAGDRRVEALALGALGTAYKNLGNYTRALALHEDALRLKRLRRDRVGEAKTLSNIGLVHWAQGDCGAALAQYDASLAILREAGDERTSATVLNNRGLCLDELGRYDQSVETYRQSRALHQRFGDARGEAQALGNLGGVQLLRGRYREAAATYTAALALDDRIQDQQARALDLINLAEAQLAIADPPTALATLERARALAAAGGFAREEADAVRARGNVQARLGRYEDARRALEQALTVYERSGLPNEQVDTLDALGKLALDLGDLAVAEQAARRALATATRTGFAAGVLRAMLAAGRIAERRGQLDEARDEYQAAGRRAADSRDLGSEALAALALARVALARGDPAAATASADRAAAAAREGGARLLEADALITSGLAADVRGARADALNRFRAAEEIGRTADVTDLQWRAAYGRGLALEHEGRPRDAVGAYSRAVAVIERVREGLSSSRARSGFLDDKGEVYAALIRVLLQLKRTPEAFDVAERLRTTGYFDLLARSLLLAGESPGTPMRDLLARIAQLQARLSAREASPRRERAAGHAVIRADLAEAERAWSEAVDRETRADPVMATLRQHRASAPSSIQRALPPATALLQFVVAKHELTAFVLTADAIRARAVPLSEPVLRARVELLRALLRRPSDDGWVAVAARLHAELIAPMVHAGWLTGIERLYVVPHGVLNYVPFAVLVHGTPERPRLMVEDFALALLPAASLLVGPHGTAAPSDALLAVAPEPVRLPHSRREVERVGALFPAPDVRVGAAAGERAFKVAAGRYRVVHLATHGFFDRFNPLLSGIELNADSGEDGRLQVLEILGLRLQSVLVTLSACDTALGAGEVNDLPPGEEIVGVTRAFLSAGTRGVLASLWEVRDDTMPDFMGRFYGDARREDLPAALASAQVQQWRAGDGRSHPYYWASFLMVGPVIGERLTKTAQTGP